jgi:hypothetical protein
MSEDKNKGAEETGAEETGDGGDDKLGGTTNFSYDPEYYGAKEIEELTQKHMDKLEDLLVGYLSDLPDGAFVETNIFFTIDYDNEEDFKSNKNGKSGMHLI